MDYKVQKMEQMEEEEDSIDPPENPPVTLLKGSSIHGTSRKWNPKNMLFHECSQCEEILYNKQALLRHQMERHNFIPNFKCDQCGVILIDKESIESHIENHKKKKNFECPVCSEKFTTDTSLIRHIRYKHTNERQYKCMLCGFAAVEHCKLQDHIRTHTGEAPYKCNECNATFKAKVSLTRHKATHSKVREYICTLCFQQFPISNGLRTHLRLIHAVDNTFITGVENTKQHGVPSELEVFFKMVKKNPEDAGKLKYYVIKEEFKRDLSRYFKNVSPLLTSALENSTGHSLPEGNKGRPGDTWIGFVPPMGRPRKVKDEPENSNQTKRKQMKRKKKIEQTEQLDERENVRGTNLHSENPAVSERTVKKEHENISFSSEKPLEETADVKLNSISPDKGKKRKKTEATKASPGAKKVMKEAQDGDQLNHTKPLGKETEINTISCGEKTDHSFETGAEIDGCLSEETLDACSFIMTAKAGEDDVDRTKEARNSSAEEKIDTVLGSEKSGDSREIVDTMQVSADIIEELQEERVLEFVYVDNLDGNNDARDKDVKTTPQGESAGRNTDNSTDRQSNISNKTIDEDEINDRRQVIEAASEKEDFLSNTVKGHEIDKNKQGESAVDVQNEHRRQNLENICTRLTDGAQLRKLKEGGYGKRPQVIEILANGTVLDITEEYLEHLPLNLL